MKFAVVAAVITWGLAWALWRTGLLAPALLGVFLTCCAYNATAIGAAMAAHPYDHNATRWAAYWFAASFVAVAIVAAFL